MNLPPIPFFFKTRAADPTNAILYKAINEVPSESKNRSFMCSGSRPLFVNNETDERAMVNGLPAWIMDGSYADQFTFSTMPNIIDNGVIEELPKATLADIQRQFPLLPKQFVGYTDHTCYWFMPTEPPGAAAAPQQSYAAVVALPAQDEPSGAAEYIPPAPVVVPRAAPRNRNAEVVSTHRSVEKVTTQKYRNAPPHPSRQSLRGKKPSVGGYRRKSKRKNKKYNK